MIDFEEGKKVIGVIHLKPLPGSPLFQDMDEVIESALDDARNLIDGGVDAVLVENFGDIPYWKIITEETFSSMMDVCRTVREEVEITMGVNVLRNDWKSALMIAGELDLSFVRVNVYTGVTLTEQGVIEGEAGKIQRFKNRKNIQADIFADIHVKHGITVYPEDIETAALDAVERGLADAVIVSGDRTGKPVSLQELKTVKSTVQVPVIVGSGADKDNIKELFEYADGAIVGTSFKKGGDVKKPVDPERVREFMNSF